MSTITYHNVLSYLCYPLACSARAGSLLAPSTALSAAPYCGSRRTALGMPLHAPCQTARDSTHCMGRLSTLNTLCRAQ
ncbi:hypothetical protein OBBRIDRAFT_24515 [Obba rivulosa]|uniref:Uncharacterized protein n=1 Tax=Obba rivulosa TaxID=1052685 RepID=A0A8E2DSS5_9APHY|nr:hypothetical protein OBBRIDRAFT_24515 [Obba rivulosa]